MVAIRKMLGMVASNISGSRWSGLFQTEGLRWVVPTRIIIGVMLVFPVGGGLGHVLPALAVNTQTYSFATYLLGLLVRAIELLVGISFLAGLAVRVTAIPALLILSLLAAANFANSSSWLAGMLAGIVMPQGDWATGAVMIGAIELVSELYKTGSGRWSVDHWISTWRKK